MQAILVFILSFLLVPAFGGEVLKSVSARDFGAKGDGAADDNVVFQAKWHRG